MNREAREAIQALADLNEGRLTPALVVNSARNPDSPLHRFFEWDDTKAAEAHRLNQGRSLIRKVYIYRETEKSIVKTVAYVRDPSCSEREQGYVSIDRLKKDEYEAKSAMVAELKRAAAAMRRALNIAAALEMETPVSEVIAYIDELETEVNRDRTH